jgi:hypothetical protein
MAPALKPPPTLPLNIDRIKALHADIEAYIDARVAEEAAAVPGVPAVRIRHDLMLRAGGCQCRAYFQNSEKA